MIDGVTAKFSALVFEQLNGNGLYKRTPQTDLSQKQTPTGHMRIGRMCRSLVACQISLVDGSIAALLTEIPLLKLAFRVKSIYVC